MQFYPLEVEKIVQETPDTKSFYFRIPDDKKENFHHKAGQYLTLKCNINGKEYRRSYSICTAPDAQSPAITVKIVAGGKVSGFLNSQVSVGTTLEVMPSQGKFTVDPQHQLTRDHYFITAGSGITPVISMIKALLEEEPKSRCLLLYGSRSEDHIIFRDELNKLAEKYNGQLIVEHCLSKPLKQKSSGILGILGKGKINWEGFQGRITKDVFEIFFEKYHHLSVKMFEK